MASTMPGSPAPDPMSTSVPAPESMSSATTAQFSRCLSHSLGTSCGPIRPVLDPAGRQHLREDLGPAQRGPEHCRRAFRRRRANPRKRYGRV